MTALPELGGHSTTMMLQLAGLGMARLPRVQLFQFHVIMHEDILLFLQW